MIFSVSIRHVLLTRHFQIKVATRTEYFAKKIPTLEMDHTILITIHSKPIHTTYKNVFENEMRRFYKI